FFGLGLASLDGVLERDRAGVVEAGVAPATVVDDLDPTGDLAAGLGPSRPEAAVVELGLQRGPERLGHRVVEADSGASHGLQNPKLLAGLEQRLRGVLDSAVGVEDETVRHGPAQSVGYAQRPVHQARVLALVHRPAQHAPGVPVADRGQVEPPLAGVEVGDVAGPDRIESSL